jgi:hypothetical protein
MADVERVRQCESCGKVCDLMDTVCPRCRHFGTLRARYQCVSCGKLLDEKECRACAEAEGIRADLPTRLPAPRYSDAASPMVPDVGDPQGVPPWASGAVGGTVLGAAAGAIGAYFLNVDPVIGGVLGLVPGGLLGALMSGGHSPRRR